MTDEQPTCGYQWQAPQLFSHGGKKTITLTCVLPAGHDGDHEPDMSTTRVREQS